MAGYKSLFVFVIAFILLGYFAPTSLNVFLGRLLLAAMVTMCVPILLASIGRAKEKVSCYGKAIFITGLYNNLSLCLVCIKFLNLLCLMFFAPSSSSTRNRKPWYFPCRSPFVVLPPRAFPNHLFPIVRPLHCIFFLNCASTPPPHTLRWSFLFSVLHGSHCP